MSYKINSDKCNKIFAVPNEVVDKHIKLAGSAQLKVLLWTLRTDVEEFDLDALSKATGIARADALDAMQFWLETGVMVKIGEPAPAKVEAAEPKPRKSQPQAIAPEVLELDRSSLSDKPSTIDVARRGQESPELRILWNEAQEKLGKTLSFNDQRTLLWLHDHWGLPIEVLIMILDYCVSIDKKGMSYIEKVGINWAEEEIFSLALAEQKLTDIKNRSSLWQRLREHYGFQSAHPTQKQSEMLDRWTRQLHFQFDMISLAFDECLNRTMKTDMRYVNKVLENWHESGFKTPADVKNAASKPRQSGGRGDGASYSLDKFEQASLSGSIVYKSKKED